MKQPMRAPACRILPLIPMLLLANCASSDWSGPRAAAPPPAVTVRSEQGPAARKAAIRAQLAALCPTPLSDDELAWAADFVEAHRSRGAVWIAGRLLRMHRETRLCRGG